MVAMAGAGLVHRCAHLCLVSAPRAADPTRRASGRDGRDLPELGFVGYPVMLLAFPDQAGLVLALNTTVENLLIIPLSLVLFELVETRCPAGPFGRKVAKALAGVLARPYMIGLLAGLAWSLAGLPLPEAADRTLGIPRRLGRRAVAVRDRRHPVGPVARRQPPRRAPDRPGQAAAASGDHGADGAARSPGRPCPVARNGDGSRSCRRRCRSSGSTRSWPRISAARAWPRLAITLTTLGGFATISAALWLLL